MTATSYVVINIYNKEFLSKQQTIILKFFGFLFLSKFFIMYVLYVYIKVTIIYIYIYIFFFFFDERLQLYFETYSKVMLNFLK